MTSQTRTSPDQKHIPVLLGNTVALLAPQSGESYLDLTAGYGGHAIAIIERIGDAHLATLVDRDESAIAALQPLARAGATIIHSDFGTATERLAKEGRQYDMVLLDLGVSSPQLDNLERGFSLQRSGPLDMRMDQSQARTAAEIVNTFSEEQLAHIIHDYGEEPRARLIARAIVAARPLQTTSELAEVIATAVRGRRGRIHPATRTFQAVRIALNQELEQLTQTLPLLPRLLKSGGRLAIISFHSLEDRLTKRFLKEQAESGFEATLNLITKKPISGATEDVYNPRARSAQLRAAVKK